MALQDSVHKKFFKELPASEVSDRAIAESISKVKDRQLLREKVTEKGKYRVLILGSNEKSGVPIKELFELQEAIQKEGFPCCTLGSHYYEKAKRDSIAKGAPESDVQKAMLNDNHLIILIDSQKPAVVDESKAIRENKSWKRKTLFFFRYKDYEELVAMARERKYPIDFKFPIPYKESKELKAKVLFGVHHCYLYTIRKNEPTEQQIDGDENGKAT